MRQSSSLEEAEITSRRITGGGEPQLLAMVSRHRQRCWCQDDHANLRSPSDTVLVDERMILRIP